MIDVKNLRSIVHAGTLTGALMTLASLSAIAVPAADPLPADRSVCPLDAPNRVAEDDKNPATRAGVSWSGSDAPTTAPEEPTTCSWFSHGSSRATRRSMRDWGNYHIVLASSEDGCRLEIMSEEGTLFAVTDTAIEYDFVEATGFGDLELRVLNQPMGSCCTGTEHWFSQDDGFQRLFSLDLGRGERGAVREVDHRGRPEFVFEVTDWVDGLIVCNSSPGCRLRRPVVVGWDGGRYRELTHMYPELSRSVAAAYLDDLDEQPANSIAGFYLNALLAGDGARSLWLARELTAHHQVYVDLAGIHALAAREVVEQGDATPSASTSARSRRPARSRRRVTAVGGHPLSIVKTLSPEKMGEPAFVLEGSSLSAPLTVPLFIDGTFDRDNCSVQHDFFAFELDRRTVYIHENNAYCGGEGCRVLDTYTREFRRPGGGCITAPEPHLRVLRPTPIGLGWVAAYGSSEGWGSVALGPYDEVSGFVPVLTFDLGMAGDLYAVMREGGVLHLDSNCDLMAPGCAADADDPVRHYVWTRRSGLRLY